MKRSFIFILIFFLVLCIPVLIMLKNDTISNKKSLSNQSIKSSNEDIIGPDEGHIPGKVALLYSLIGSTDSEVKILENNKEVSDINVSSKQGFNKITHDKKGNIWIYGASNSSLYSIDVNNNVKEEKIIDSAVATNFLLFEDEDMLALLKDKDPDFNWISIRNPYISVNLRLEGFSQFATMDENFYYIYSAIVPKQRCILYVVDRHTGKLANTISIPSYGAEDIKIFAGKILLSTKPYITVISPKENWTVSTLPINNFIPKSFYAKNDNELYIVLLDQNSKANVITMDSNLNLLSSKNLNFYCYNAIFKNEYLYIYSDIKYKDKTSIIGVFKLGSWEKIGQTTFTNNKNSLPLFDIAVTE